MDEILKKQLDRIESYAMLMAKDILTLKEAAFILGMKPETVRKLAHNHVFPVYKPNRNLLYFKREDLECWMLSNKSCSDAEIASKAEKISLTIKNRRKCSLQ